MCVWVWVASPIGAVPKNTYFVVITVTPVKDEERDVVLLADATEVADVTGVAGVSPFVSR